MLCDSETRVEEATNVTEQHQSTEDPVTIPMQNHEFAHEESFEELHWPIALRKGKRSCTRHPIVRDVSYQKLSPHMKAFMAKRKHSQEL